MGATVIPVMNDIGSRADRYKPLTITPNHFEIGFIHRADLYLQFLPSRQPF